MDSVKDNIYLESNGKRRLKTRSQVEGLERFYAEEKYPTEAMKGKLAVELMLSEQQVHKWFCHRRQKEKKSKINDTNSGGKQYRGIGSRKDGSRKVKRLSLSSLKRVENQMPLNIRNPRSAGIGLELNDENVNPGNSNAIENTFVRIISSQEKSTLQNGSLCKMQSTRLRLQNGNRFKMQPNRPLHQRENPNKIESKKRKRKSEVATGQTHVQEDAYHVAVTAVQSYLSGRFREDGPPLSIEFDPLPPGAFDTPLVPCYEENPASQDVQLMPTKKKMGRSSHLPKLRLIQPNRDSAKEAPTSAFFSTGLQSGHNKFRAGRSGGKVLLPPRYAPMHAEIGNMDREVQIAGPSDDVDPFPDVETYRGITDTYAGMPDEWQSNLPSVQGEDEVQPKYMTMKKRNQEKNLQKKQGYVLKLKHNIFQEERRLQSQREICKSQKQRDNTKVTAARKGNAKKQSRKSEKLIEDECLELRDLQITSNAVGIETDETGRPNSEYHEGLPGRFPPASLKMKQLCLAHPWKDSKENVRNLFMVFRFLHTLADVIGLCPFTLDEFLQAFHDHDSKLLGQIHIALLKLLLEDVESELQSSVSAGKRIQCDSSLNDGSFLRLTQAVKRRSFDVTVWKEFLNPLTWPEILRQVAVDAGFCPKRKKEMQMLSKTVDKEGSQTGYHGLVPGTLKAALFRILSQEGANGLKIPEIAKHVQNCDLNDLPSSNALEALIYSSLSSDITLFERISSSAFRLRANFIHSRDGDHSCSETSGDMDSDTEESDSEESDTGGSAESAYEEQVIAHALENGREGITGTPQALQSARECRSQHEAISDLGNEGNEADRHCTDGTEIDESHVGDAWVLGLMEGEYADLSVEEKLNALVALFNLVNSGNSVQRTIKDPSRTVSQFYSQVELHGIGNKQGRKKSTAANRRSVNPSKKTSKKRKRDLKLSDLDSKSQASDPCCPESFSTESICLGSDRRHNMYWQFFGGNLPDPGRGRLYFESSEDGHWEVIDNEEALDTLMALLDSRGVREANLLASLRSQGTLLRQEMRKLKSGVNQESEKYVREILSGDSSSGVSIIENNQNDTAFEPENDSSVFSGAISLQFGRTEVEKQHDWDNHRAFDRWVWSDFFRTLKVLKYNADRLLPCESCHDLYWPEEEHCMLCHTTFELDFDSEERYAVHVARCKGRGQDESIQGCKVLSSRLQSLKAGMQAVEAVLPEEALEVSWKRSGQKVWIKHLRRASSPTELAEVLTDLQNAIRDDWLLRSQSTCRERIPFFPGIPQTTASMSFWLMRLDALISVNWEKFSPKDARQRRTCSKGKSAFS